MKKLLISIMLIIASSPAFAVDATPLFSVYAGAGSWSAEISGDLGDTNTNVDDLGLDDDSNAFVYVAFEHAVPLIPQVRLERSAVSSEGSGTTVFTFSDTPFDGDIDSDIDITMTDATLYYEILVLDFGLTLRQFDAEVQATGTVPSVGVETESESVDGVLPLLYLGTKIDLPLTGLYLAGNVNGISADDESIMDYRGSVGYGIELSFLAKIGLELGYRAFEIDMGEDEDYAGDIDFSGVYFGVNVKF